MENASKALTMATSLLIALVIIGVLLMVVKNISSIKSAQISEEEKNQIVEYNKQYLKYDGQYIYGTELVSLLNRAIDKQEDLTININFENTYEYNGYIKNAEGRYEKQKITIAKNDTAKINAADGDAIDKAGQITALAEAGGINNAAFKCTKIEYDNYGKINKIYFEEKKWGDLYSV